jgi:hypothetical protein
MNNKKYSIKYKQTGDGFFSFGKHFELINELKGLVVFRKSHYTNELDNSNCYWEDNFYLFYKNI